MFIIYSNELQVILLGVPNKRILFCLKAEFGKKFSYKIITGSSMFVCLFKKGGICVPCLFRMKHICILVGFTVMITLFNFIIDDFANHFIIKERNLLVLWTFSSVRLKATPQDNYHNEIGVKYWMKIRINF